MPYGTIKVDTITFTDGGIDKSVSISGLTQNPTFTGNVTVTGTVSGATVRATTISGVTISGTTVNAASGVFTTQISGAVVVAPAGLVGTPSVQVGTGATVAPGFYGAGTDQLGISTGGSSRLVVDSVGQIRVITGGSEAAPALVVGNDLNTGIYAPGADQVAISTGGSGRLFVDASGNIGINTSPSSLGTSITTLEIKGGSTTRSGGLRISSSDSSVKGAFYIYDGAGILGTESATPLDLYTGNSPRLRITSAGLVGVGTSSPQDKLAVVGVNGNFTEAAIRVNGSSATTNSDSGLRLYANCSTGTKNWLIAANYSTANTLEITPSTANGGAAYSTPTAVFTSAGLVGIGTSSPLTKLDVRSGVITAGSNSSTNGSEILRGYYTNTDGALAVIGTEYSSGGIVIGFAVKPSTSASGQFLSSTGINIERGAYTIAGNIHKWYIGSLQTVPENSSVSTSEVMRIDSSGRLGIGTTSVSSKLHVLNPSGGSSTTEVSTIERDNSGYFIKLYRNAGSGNAGGLIGADSLGTYFTGGHNTNNQLYIDSNGLMQFYTNSAERARIDSSGRLLVGTSSAPTSGGYNQYAKLVSQGNTAGAGLAGLCALNRGEGASSITTDEEIGAITFGDSAGNEFATIVCRADANAGSGDYPGRLVFSTTADGASFPTERWRYSNNGETRISNMAEVFPITDNACLLGKSGFRWSAVWAANGTIQTSDQRAKTDVTAASLGSEFIKSLRPVSYKWIEGGKRPTGDFDKDNNYIYESVPGSRTHWGFIAQEVKEAVDAAGVDFGGWVLTDKDDPDSQQALRYDQFIAPLTKALQEALAEIDVLKAKVAALESA